MQNYIILKTKYKILIWCITATKLLIDNAKLDNNNLTEEI